jgi:hypothetical protein
VILPTKRIGEDRALLTLGGEILMQLEEPKTVSRLWEDIKLHRQRRNRDTLVTFDWFVLSLDLLYSLGAVNLHEGVIRKHNRDQTTV